MNIMDTVIARAVEQAQGGSVTLEFGRVTAVSQKTVTVTVGGVSVPNVPAMDSYNAVAGDWAWLLRTGSLLVAIGRTKGTVNEEDKDA